jgi:adsorption protein B
MALRALVPAAAQLPPLAGRGLTALLWLNAGLLLWRLAMRAAFTAHAYGPFEGIRAIPRALIGNIINAAAAWTAITRYGRSVRGEARLRWDKTEHRFPAEPAGDSIEPGQP